MTPEQELASRVAGTLLAQAASHAARALAEKIRGSAQERAFRAAVSAGVGRFMERYPGLGPIAIDTEYFGNPEVVDRLFSLVMDDDEAALAWLSREFRKTYEDHRIFGTSAETALTEFVRVLEEEMTETGIIGRRDLKYLRRIEGMLRDAPGRSGPLLPADALKELRHIRERVQLTVGDALSTRIVVDQDVASIQLVPLAGRVVAIHGRVTFRFPNDPDGTAAREQLLRAIETGTEATIPRQFIASAELRVNGKTIPGTEGLPEQVRVRAGPPNPLASRISVYRLGRLLASVDVPHLAQIRGGTRQAEFETEPGRALSVNLTLKAPPESTVKGEFEIHFALVRDAREGWPLMRFLLCAPSADQMVWEVIETGRRLSLRRPSTPAPPVASLRYLAHLRALAAIQEATGYTMKWPWQGVTREEIRRSLRVARALRAGARVRIYEPFEITLDERADMTSIMRDAGNGEVGLSVLEPSHQADVGGSRLELGPVLLWFPTVRVEDQDRSLRIRPGSDRRAFEIFVNYAQFEAVEPADQRKVIFSAPGSYPLAMLGLRRRTAG